MDVPVCPCRSGPYEQRRVHMAEAGDEAVRPEARDPRLPRKAARGAGLTLVPQTDTGGRGENPKALERTLAKELGKFPP
jgi:hypothetical protein